MIAPHLVEQVEKLLAGGKLSHRKIARITGISRGTIGAIASGKRSIRPRPTDLWDEEPAIPERPPERCPSCGGMVYMPCRLCRTRKRMAGLPELRALILANVRQPFTFLGLNLKPMHRERYEEVHRWRLEQMIRWDKELRWSEKCTVAHGAAVQAPPKHYSKPSP